MQEPLRPLPRATLMFVLLFQLTIERYVAVGYLPKGVFEKKMNIEKGTQKSREQWRNRLQFHLHVQWQHHLVVGGTRVTCEVTRLFYWVSFHGTVTSASGRTIRHSTRRRRDPAAFTTTLTALRERSKAMSSGVSCGASTSSA